MVSISDTRELLLVLALIAGFSGVLAVMDTPLPFSFDLPKELPTISRASHILGASTRVMLVANPVVHIEVPKHNIFAPQ